MTIIKDDLFSYVKHANILNQDFISSIPQPSKEVQEMLYQLVFLDMYGTHLNYPKVDLAKKDISKAEETIDKELLTKYKQKLTGLQTTFKNPESSLSITIKGLATNIQDQDIPEFYRCLTAKLMDIPFQTTNPRLVNTIMTINAIMSNNPQNPQQQSSMTIAIIVFLVILMFFLYITFLKPYLKNKKEDSDSESDSDE